ncbi:MAG: hypothetical protein ACOC6C_03505 [Verrucomicrobiota bacterium]
MINNDLKVVWSCIGICLAISMAAGVSLAQGSGDKEEAEAKKEIEQPATPSAAEEGPVVNVTLLEGGLELTAAYHSNPYYRDDEAEEGGMVFNLSPSVRIAYPANELLHFSVFGKVDYTSVVLDDGDDALDTQNEEVLHPYITGRVRYNPSEFSSFVLSDTYQQANIEDDITGDKYYLNDASLQYRQDIGNRASTKIWVRNMTVNEDSGGVLFDHKDNSGGAVITYVLTEINGRHVRMGLHGSVGRKKFEEETFLGHGVDKTNPKTHDYYTADLSVAFPLSDGLLGRLKCGWVGRRYETTGDGRDQETDGVSANGSLTMIPGGLATFTLAGSYDVVDTIVFSDSQPQQRVFDSLDPLINNLDSSYREQEVWRVGINGRYPFSEVMELGASAVYQESHSDKEEDLTRISGQSGIEPRNLDEERLTLGLRLNHRFGKHLETAVSYEHGFAERTADTADEYQFDSYAVSARILF